MRLYHPIIYTLLFLLHCQRTTGQQQRRRQQQWTVPNCGVSERRAWRDLSCEQQDQFLNAIHQLKRLGWYDDFVYTHWQYFDVTHGNEDLFLPWHRYFIWIFERAIQTVTQSCDITLPYWDWERDAGIVFDNPGGTSPPTIFDTFGEFVQGRFDGSCSWVTWGTEECLSRQLGREGNSVLSGEAQILALITSYRTFQDTTDPTNGELNNGFASAMEGTPHQRPHHYIAGDMLSPTSPDDPLFFLHHANVDRIWAMWQDWWEHDEHVFQERQNFDSPLHYANTGVWDVDEPMPFPEEGDTDWSFALPFHRQQGMIAYPTIRQVLNLRGPLINVRYVNDHLASLIPADQFFPNPRWFEPATDSVPVRCHRGGRRRRTTRERLRRKQQSIPNTNTNSSQPSSARDVSSISNSNTTDTIETCLNAVGLFTRQIDRVRWNQLCHDLPPSTTSLPERFAILAEMDCADEDQKIVLNTTNMTTTSSSFIQNERSKIMEVVQSHHIRPDLSHLLSKRPLSSSSMTMVGGANSSITDNWWWTHKPSVMECFHRPDYHR